MTDVEFEIIDELYFVISFNDLKNKVSVSEQELLFNLKELIFKGWVKCFKNISEEEEPGNINMEKKFHNYYYLASKEGLRAHNSI